MRVLEPIKRKSTGRVLGYFYRIREDGMLQYVSFNASIESIEPDKVQPATPAELEGAKEQQCAEGKRGCRTTE
jgi:hypothetical protein